MEPPRDVDEKPKETPDGEPAQPYTPPRIVLVGNMNDLLAGNGSQQADSGVCTGGAGTDPTPCP
jgi:hypothetical protein